MEKDSPNDTPQKNHHDQITGISPSSIPSPPSPPDFVSSYHNDKLNADMQDRMSKLEKIIELMYLQSERIKQEHQSIREETKILKKQEQKKHKSSRDYQKRISKLEKIMELMYHDSIRIKGENESLKKENECIQKDFEWMKESINSSSSNINNLGGTKFKNEERVTYPFVLNNQNGKYENWKEEPVNEMEGEQKKQAQTEVYIPSLSGEESTITMMEDTVTMESGDEVSDEESDKESKKSEKKVKVEVESSKYDSKDGDLELSNDNKLPCFGNIIQRVVEKMNITKPLLYNTKTIHMYALSIHYECAIHPTKWKRFSSYSLSLYSLLTIFFQILVLFSLLFESSFPTCATHTDCTLGTLCNGFSPDRFHQPRCSSCSTMILEWDKIDVQLEEEKTSTFYDRKNCSKILASSIVDWNPFWDKVDESIIWYESDYTPHFEYSLSWVGEQVNDLNSSLIMATTTTSRIEDEEVIMKCLAIKHCQEEQLSGSTVIGEEPNPTFSDESNINKTCPHLTLIMTKISGDQIAVLLFLALVFASTVAHNMREAAIENIVLDYAIDSFQNHDKSEEMNEDPDNDINGPTAPSKSTFNFNGIPLSAFLLRISSRIRIYIFPWYTAAAACSILLSEALSAKNMVLNLMAIVFVMEADNLFASLFLTSKQLDSANYLIMAAKQEEIIKEQNEQEIEGEKLPRHGLFDTSISFFGWTKILGLTVSFVMFMTTINMQSLLMSMGRSHQGCDRVLFALGLLFMGLCPGVVIVIQALWTVVFGRNTHKNTDPHENETVHAGFCSNIDDDMLLQPATKRRLFFGMLEFFRNYISFTLSWWFLYLSASLMTPEASLFYPPLQIWLSIISTLYAVFRSSLILNDYTVPTPTENESVGNSPQTNHSVSSSQHGQTSEVEQESQRSSKLSILKTNILSQKNIEDHWERLKDNTWFNVVMLFFWIGIQLWAMVSLLSVF